MTKKGMRKGINYWVINSRGSLKQLKRAHQNEIFVYTKLWRWLSSLENWLIDTHSSHKHLFDQFQSSFCFVTILSDELLKRKDILQTMSSNLTSTFYLWAFFVEVIALCWVIMYYYVHLYAVFAFSEHWADITTLRPRIWWSEAWPRPRSLPHSSLRVGPQPWARPGLKPSSRCKQIKEPAHNNPLNKI